MNRASLIGKKWATYKSNVRRDDSGEEDSKLHSQYIKEHLTDKTLQERQSSVDIIWRDRFSFR